MKRSRLFYLFAIPLAAALCFSALALAALPFRLPQFAAQAFGPPSPSLESRERVLLSALVLLQREDLLTPINVRGEAVVFEIPWGESPVLVSQRLQDAGLIQDAETFLNYLRYTGMDTQIQAGEFTLGPWMAPVEIASALLDPTPALVEFPVLAGWRAEEIAASLPTSGLEIDPDLFLQRVHDRDLEGYLFPGRYTLPRDSSVEALLNTLVGAFWQAASDELEAGFAQQGLSLHEGVILASIVEREAVVDEEMPMIASVFLNRLAIGMKLDADPTVQYALGYNASQKTWWTNPLSAQDLAFDSPYNTYLYPGLPPGPISNPGVAALRAVAFPAQTPYYYFRAACDGSGRHVFAQTFEEHVGNHCP